MSNGFFNPFSSNSGGGGPSGPIYANGVIYNDTESELEVSNVQGAIDKLAEKIKEDISADKVSYDNATSGIEADNVQNALDKLVEIVKNLNSSMVKIETLGFGLFPELWEEGLYRIQSEKIRANEYISLDIPQNISLEQYQALAAAQIINTEQTDGEFVLKALGEVPKVHIPIVVTFFTQKPFISNLIMDSVTGIYYQIVIDNRDVRLEEVNPDDIVDDMGKQLPQTEVVIADNVTGQLYRFTIEDKNVKFEEVD